jgi:hypothetical protein
MLAMEAIKFVMLYGMEIVVVALVGVTLFAGLYQLVQGKVRESRRHDRTDIFHVIQDVMEHVNTAFLAYGRNLPENTAADKAIRQELLDLRSSLLASSPTLSAAQREQVEEVLRQHTGTLLAEAYYCKEAVLALFRVSRTPRAARQRRDQIAHRFGHILELEPIITLLRGKQFENMIVCLDYENLDNTDNDVKRTIRAYQHGQDQRNLRQVLG